MPAKIRLFKRQQARHTIDISPKLLHSAFPPRPKLRRHVHQHRHAHRVRSPGEMDVHRERVDADLQIGLERPEIPPRPAKQPPYFEGPQRPAPRHRRASDRFMMQLRSRLRHRGAAYSFDHQLWLKPFQARNKLRRMQVAADLGNRDKNAFAHRPVVQRSAVRVSSSVAKGKDLGLITLNCGDRALLLPLPVTLGEGWGEGDWNVERHWCSKSPSPWPSPGVPGEGSRQRRSPLCSPISSLPR